MFCIAASLVVAVALLAKSVHVPEFEVQPAKFAVESPAFHAAVSLTEVPGENVAEQVVFPSPQLIPAGLEVTVPEEEPPTLTIMPPLLIVT